MSLSVNGTIRRIRRSRGMTLGELASRANLTKGYLSKVENGRRSPPVSTLQSLAVALGVDLAEMLDGPTDPAAHSDSLEIVRAKDGADTDHSPVATGAGYSYKSLVKSLRNKYMSPFLMVIQKGKTSVFSHDSEEFGYIVSGTVRFEYDGGNYQLKCGDSFYFDSRKPHRMINERKEPAVVLAVNFNYRRF
jgi:transcriptional regulator with XRE-family HTH domain